NVKNPATTDSDTAAVHSGNSSSGPPTGAPIPRKIAQKLNPWSTQPAASIGQLINSTRSGSPLILAAALGFSLASPSVRNSQRSTSGRVGSQVTSSIGTAAKMSGNLISPPCKGL